MSDLIIGKRVIGIELVITVSDGDSAAVIPKDTDIIICGILFR
jgi:hypothetical protein